MKNLDIIIDLLAYEGVSTNNPADAVKVRNKQQETEIVTVIRHQFPVADGVADQSIDVPEADALYTAILVDREVSIKLNGWTTALTLTPRANGIKTWAFYTRGSITGLSVSNASGSDANMDIFLARK